MKKYLLVLCLGLIFLSGHTPIFSNGDGSEEPDKPTRPKIDRHDEAGTYARVRYQYHVINPTRYFMEIKLADDRTFAGLKSEDIVAETNIHALVRLRGVYAGRGLLMENRYRPHIKVEREQARYNAAMQQVWKLLSSSEYLILRNVEVDKDVPEYHETMTEHPGIVADIYYVVGEVERNLAEDLIMDGYAVDNEFTADFGSRIP